MLEQNFKLQPLTLFEYFAIKYPEDFQDSKSCFNPFCFHQLQLAFVPKDRWSWPETPGPDNIHPVFETKPYSLQENPHLHRSSTSI